MDEYKIGYSVTNSHGFTTNHSTHYKGQLGDYNHLLESHLKALHENARAVNVLEVVKHKANP